MSEEELLRLAQTELAHVLGIRVPPDRVWIYRHVGAIPQYEVGHLDVVAQIRKLTARHPNLEVAGNAYDGIGLPDSIRSGQEAAKTVFDEINLAISPTE